MPKPDNSKELDALARILSTGRLMTAAQIALETGCGKTTAHKRIRQLKERGHNLVQQRVREGVSGPKAIAYALASKRKKARS